MALKPMVPFPSTPSGSTEPAEKAKPLAVFFFALMFFLCSSDLFFATRIGGFNFRWGQALLLICSLISLWDLRGQRRLQSKSWQRHIELLKNWMPFFAIYAIATCLGASPSRSLLKWGWALFNIGGAGLLFLNNRWRRSLELGTALGILAIALVIWIQLILLYWFGLQGTPETKFLYQLTSTSLSSLPLGYAQYCMNYLGIIILRPSAFYYVPSFAACALVFSMGCLILVIDPKNKDGWRTLIPLGILSTAVLLTTSRSGILGLIVVSSFICLTAIFKKKPIFIRLVFKVMVVALLLIVLFGMASNGRKYLSFYNFLLNPFDISIRLHDPESSEGGRLASILHALQLWKQHFILGNGVSTLPGKEPGLGQLAENTWVELPVESGLLGLLAFLWALFRTLRQAFKLNKDVEAGILLGACLLAHFLINLNFTATFPRLDYWILFFFCVHLLRRHEPA